MPNQISEEVKIQRCSKLFKLQEKIKRELLALELDRKSVPVLFETYRDGVNCGHSDNFIEYRLESNEDLTGHMVNVVPCSVQNDYISAK